MEWKVTKSPTDSDMYAVRGVDLVADSLPIEDARLIAAAPDLLKTLRMLRNTVGDLRNGFSKSVDSSRWVDQFQAAADRSIAKAEGRS